MISANALCDNEAGFPRSHPRSNPILCGVNQQITPIIELLAFYFLLCLPALQLGLVSLLSIFVFIALFLVILCSFLLLSYCTL